MTQQPKNDTHPYAPNDEPADAAGEQQPPPPPQNELPTITQMKKMCCERLTKIFTGELMNERLMKMAGGDASRVAKNLTAFLSVITQDGGSGQPKKYYYQCSIPSLVTCFLESMNMQLPFDSRNLVSMVIYDWEAELDISYKGFINALNKHYRDSYVDAKIVFKDDLFQCEETGGKAVFKHISKDNFRTVDEKFTDVVGAYCYFSYSLENGEPVSRIVRMSRDDILKVKSKAKTKNVWNDFASEMGIKAVIRRASKIPFAAIDLDIDLEEVGNRHYALDQPGGDQRLKLLMAAQQEVVNGKPAEEKPTDPNAANPGSGSASPAPADDGKKSETSPASVGEPTGNAAAAPLPADDGKPKPASGDGPQPRDDDNNRAGDAITSAAVVTAPAADPVGLEPTHQPISDADFEDIKP